jgi:hypothetical protein
MQQTTHHKTPDKEGDVPKQKGQAACRYDARGKGKGRPVGVGGEKQSDVPRISEWVLFLAAAETFSRFFIGLLHSPCYELRNAQKRIKQIEQIICGKSGREKNDESDVHLPQPQNKRSYFISFLIVFLVFLIIFLFFVMSPNGFLEYFYRAFLGISQQGEFTNAINKNCGKCSAAAKKKYLLACVTFFFYTPPPLFSSPRRPLRSRCSPAPRRALHTTHDMSHVRYSPLHTPHMCGMLCDITPSAQKGPNSARWHFFFRPLIRGSLGVG